MYAAGRMLRAEALTSTITQDRPKQEVVDYQAAINRLQRAALYATNEGCKQYLLLARFYETMLRANEALEKSRELLGRE